VGEASAGGTVTNSQDRLECLDWLRAFAIGAVVIGHSANEYAPGGAVGVSVFFCLSGYLIARILLRPGMLTPGNIVKFMVRRIGRIYPLYALQIAAILLLMWLFEPTLLPKLEPHLEGLLTFTGLYGPWVGFGAGVLWSLQVEFWFYVSFPFLLWAASACGVVVPVILCGTALSIAAKALPGAPLPVRYYDHLLIGVLAAVCVNADRIPQLFTRRMTMAASWAALFVLVLVIPYAGSRGALWYTQSLAAAMLTAGLILCYAAEPVSLRLPPVAFLGRISYSIYLVHGVVLDFAQLRLSVLLPTVVVLSAATYYLIEQPGIRATHRLTTFRPWPRRVAPPSVEIMRTT
jgi:peptidoglycan/LPS O-acetylase OafA/YrhL